MALVSFSNSLMEEYKNLYNNCVIDSNRTGLVENILPKCFQTSHAMKQLVKSLKYHGFL